MAYASAVEVTATPITRAGVDITTLPTTPTATHGNKFGFSSRNALIVKNGSASPLVITLDIPGLVDGQAVTDRTITMAAGKIYLIGPFIDVYAQSDNFVWATFDAVTDNTIGVYSLG